MNRHTAPLKQRMAECTARQHSSPKNDKCSGKRPFISVGAPARVQLETIPAGSFPDWSVDSSKVHRRSSESALLHRANNSIFRVSHGDNRAQGKSVDTGLHEQDAPTSSSDARSLLTLREVLRHILWLGSRLARTLGLALHVSAAQAWSTTFRDRTAFNNIKALIHGVRCRFLRITPQPEVIFYEMVQTWKTASHKRKHRQQKVLPKQRSCSQWRERETISMNCWFLNINKRHG